MWQRIGGESVESKCDDEVFGKVCYISERTFVHKLRKNSKSFLTWFCFRVSGTLVRMAEEGGG